jgi:hypothetical protein
MPLRLFKSDLAITRKRPPCVTVRTDGRLTFNAEASRALESAGLRRVRLFGDPSTGRVVLRAAAEDGPEVHLISYLKPRPTQIRATLEARPFLVWIGYLKPQADERPSKATSALESFELRPLRPYRGLNAFEFYLRATTTLDGPESPRDPTPFPGPESQ